ncbi:DgyrCDS9074 [Dimorphilus gyrociliatus]|uniref:DgyrCDS9074 n=1 Tax=Dimorphilus gyrociliatus TaxID=2664684 RepID=A0A7I8VXR5_9ANNE|nr:DgyrCDS9074 [Dimorphilus gyrociliatus]
MAPKYELIYFNARGRAEGVRYIFALTGQDYTDSRYTNEEWQKIKNDIPSKQVPALKVDNQYIPQSNAIIRYLGKKFNLIGKTDMDAAIIDSAMGCADDIASGFIAMKFGGLNEEQTKAKAEKMKTEIVPKMLEYFEHALSADGFLTSTKALTIGELSTSLTIEWVQLFLPDFDLSKYPKTVKMLKNVVENPKIAAWIKKRPVTEH